MLTDLIHLLRDRGATVVVGLVLGGLFAWVVGRYRRYRQKRSILAGDARDTVVINHHLVERVDAPPGSSVDGGPVSVNLRIRSLGQSEVSRVVPNGYLASELLRRALRVTPNDTLISMEGAKGSYLLEALTNFVCDRVGNAPFDHDLYVMAPCCEPAGLAEHQPIVIILIAVADLALFESWPTCKNVKVEHGSDGARILTLLEMARRFREEQAKIAHLRHTGQRTRYVETMYILDLALDKRSARIPVRDVPWGRFENVLRQRNLE